MTSQKKAYLIGGALLGVFALGTVFFGRPGDAGAGIFGAVIGGVVMAFALMPERLFRRRQNQP